jgi:hypothetical protein
MYDMVQEDMMMGRGFVPKVTKAVKRIITARKAPPRRSAAPAGSRPRSISSSSNMLKMVKRATGAPATMRRIKGIVRGAALMGMDFTDDAMMGSWLQDVAKKIRGVAQNVKNIQLTTNRGTAQVGPDGVTWTDQTAINKATESPTITQSAAGGLQDVLKNPLLIGAGISLAALLLTKKKKRGK